MQVDDHRNQQHQTAGQFENGRPSATDTMVNAGSAHEHHSGSTDGAGSNKQCVKAVVATVLAQFKIESLHGLFMSCHCTDCAGANEYRLIA